MFLLSEVVAAIINLLFVTATPLNVSTTSHVTACHHMFFFFGGCVVTAVTVTVSRHVVRFWQLLTAHNI